MPINQHSSSPQKRLESLMAARLSEGADKGKKTSAFLRLFFMIMEKKKSTSIDINIVEKIEKHNVM